jgi:hypothetical protein
MVEHGGCGAGQMRTAIRWNTDLLRESRSSRYSRRKILSLGEFSGLESQAAGPIPLLPAGGVHVHVACRFQRGDVVGKA